MVQNNELISAKWFKTSLKSLHFGSRHGVNLWAMVQGVECISAQWTSKSKHNGAGRGQIIRFLVQDKE
jgi:hypothetical protein